MADEGFHEIQLSGKQLIFLSMATTVILVAVFLTGVVVGRGVRAQKDPTPDVVTAADTGGQASASTPTSAAAPPPPAITNAPPTPSDEELSFPTRLQGTTPPAGGAKAEGRPAGPPTTAAPATPPVTPAPKPAAPATPTAAPSPAPAAATTPAGSDPAGPGFLLKVVAYSGRAQADTLVKRLAAAGYNAYIVPVTRKGSTVYSVRVGKFPTRREAEAAKRRLEKEERLKPSVSR